MEFVNLTSHTINLPGMAIPPSGTVARAAATDTPIGDIDGIPVITTTYGGIQDLPDPVEGTVYIAARFLPSGEQRFHCFCRYRFWHQKYKLVASHNYAVDSCRSLADF